MTMDVCFVYICILVRLRCFFELRASCVCVGV
jgi:hypothetical protein